MGRLGLECCVCDNRLQQLPFYSQKSSPSFCSGNCEKLFLVSQGLVLGSILQSIFRDACDSTKCYRVKNSDDNLQLQGSNTNGFQEESIVLRKTRDCVGLTVKTKETKDRLPDLAASDSEHDVSVVEILPGKKTESGKQKLHSYGITTRSRHKAHKKTVKETSKFRTKSLHINLSNVDRVKLEELTVISNNSHNHATDWSDPEVVENNNTDVNCPYELDRSNTVNQSHDKPRTSVNHVHANDKKASIAIKSLKRPVACKRCGKIVSKSYLFAHYQAAHRDHLQDICAASLSCSECGQLFLRKQALNAHKVRQHNHQLSVTCSHCGKGFDSRFGLSWHMRQIHKVTVRQCGTCGETFNNRREYKKHRRYQHATNSHVCHICGKKFKLKNALQSHLDAHAGVKLHFCEICGDGFVRFSSLCQHKSNLHDSDKLGLPFKCHLCPQTFKQEAWLEKHITRKHSGMEIEADCEQCRSYLKTAVRCGVHGESSEPPAFPCPRCGKAFSKESNLKVHARQHEEPRFACGVCQRRFTYKSNMLRHRRTHSAEKDFRCLVCSKAFCSRFLLDSHARLHNQELLYRCPVCSKGLTRKDYLKNHVRKMHPQQAQL